MGLYDYGLESDNDQGGLYSYGGGRKSRSSAAVLNPEEEQSLMRDVAGGALSGLAALGNLLDLPGSMVRDALAGDNPLDQLFTPTSHVNRISGRDMLRKGGFVGKDDTWGNWLGGFAVELATDPLSFTGIPGMSKPLTKAGGIAKKAGVLDDALKLAGKGVGPRTAAMKTSLEDVIAAIPAAEAKLTAAAGGKANLDAIRSSKLGGAFGFEIPFFDPVVATKGDGFEKAAKTLDAVGDAIVYGRYSPVRAMAPLFDKSVKGLSRADDQRVARELSKREAAAEAAAKLETSDFQRVLDQSGHLRGPELVENSNALYRYAEGVDPVLPERFKNVEPWLNKSRELMQEDIAAETAAGLDTHELNDAISYMPRLKVDDGVRTTQLSSYGKIAALDNPHYIARKLGLRDHKEGTALIQEMSLDPEFAGIAAKYEGGKIPRAEFNRARDLLLQKYGPRLFGNMMDRQRGMIGAAIELEGKELANWVKEMGGAAADEVSGVANPAREARVQAKEAARYTELYNERIAEGATPVQAAADASEFVAAERASAGWKGIPDLTDAGDYTAGFEKEFNAALNDLAGSIFMRDKSLVDRRIPMFDPNPANAVAHRHIYSLKTREAAETTIDYLAGKVQSANDIPVGPGYKSMHDTLTAMRLTDIAWERVLDKMQPDDIAKIEDAVRKDAVDTWMAGGRYNRKRGTYEMPHIGQNAIDLDTGELTTYATREMTESELDQAIKDIYAGAEVTPAKMKKFAYISDEDYAAVGGFMDAFRNPQEVNKYVEVFDSITSLFKTGVTTIFPRFHMRNLISGMFQNYQGGGLTDPTKQGIKRYLAPVVDAKTLMEGGVIQDAHKIAQLGAQNAEDATKRIADYVYSYGLTGGQGLSLATDTLGFDAMADSVKSIPGVVPMPTWMDAARSIKFPTPSRIRQAYAEGGLNPRNVRGVMGQTETKFLPAKAGEAVSNYIENLNRITPFISFLRQGMDPAEAARRVMALQVDYRNLSHFERQVAKRAIPFYSFTRGMLPAFLEEMVERPGGKLGQVIRAARTSRDEDKVMPDYISESAAIPLGDLPDGSQRFLTGFGLMAEDPLSFGGGGVRGAMLETASRLNPLVKAPLEWMTGQTFFQKGPLGGRPLGDLDPTVGRMISNFVGWEDAAKSWLGTKDATTVAEFTLGNSPLSAVLTTMRQVSDPRKSLGFKALNLLTGVRVSDLSPAAQDALAREKLQLLLTESGGKVFTRTYLPKDSDLSGLSESEVEKAHQIHAMLNVLADRTKQRMRERAEREKAAK